MSNIGRDKIKLRVSYVKNVKNRYLSLKFCKILGDVYEKGELCQNNQRYRCDNLELRYIFSANLRLILYHNHQKRKISGYLSAGSYRTTITCNHSSASAPPDNTIYILHIKYNLHDIVVNHWGFYYILSHSARRQQHNKFLAICRSRYA